MKNIKHLSLIALLLAASGILWFSFRGSHPSSPEGKTPLTTLSFDRQTLSLDTLAYHEKRRATFTLTNTGSHPLFIRNVETSCGCTKVEWPRRPIPPGKTGKITLTFSPNSLGFFSKNINVFCNTPTPLHRLRIKGFVTEHASPKSP